MKKSADTFVSTDELHIDFYFCQNLQLFFIKVDDVRAYTFQPQMTSHTGLRNFSGPHPTYSLAWIGMGLDKNMVKNEGTMHKVLLLY